MVDRDRDIHIAAACDESYCMPLAVMLASVVSSLTERHHAVVHVLEHNISDETKKRVERSVPADRMSIFWIPISSDRLVWLQRNIRSYDHFSIASLFRLLLPDALPPSLDKVLYLDCDIVVRRDLGQLWRLEVGDSYVLAVPELDPAYRYVSSRLAIPHYREIGLAADARYFNAGVLVVNLQKWRAELFTERTLNYLSEVGHLSRWQDQDALNVVTAGKWSKLDPRWNVTFHASFGRRSPPCNDPHLRDPFIVHFTSSIKPWHPGYAFGFRELFFHHLDRTAWANWRPSPARFGAARRWTGLLVKAARKRIHALKRFYLSFEAGALKRWQFRLQPFKKLDQSTIPKSVANEIRLFVVLEEWTPVLPFLLSHYLASGVDRAIVAVGGIGLEEAQIDQIRGERVHVFATGSAPRYRILRGMLDRYGCGCWCLLNSGDELLVYPHSDKISLRGLCAQLGTVGAQALSCQMLDMAPADVLCEQDYRMGESPLAVYSRFDPRFQRVETVASDPVTGRVFRASLAVGVEKLNTAEPYIFRSKEHFGTYPCRSKVALLKYRKGLGMAADLRAIVGARLSEVEGAILCFRQCRSGESPAEASDNMQQSLSASPFPALEKTDPRATDDHGRSCCIQFQDTSQLARLGLLRSSVGLDRYLRQCEDGKSP